MADWQSRIVGEGTEDPTQLLANPLNWRTHPFEQKEALKGALNEIGWIQRVIVNKTTGHVVDGHARVELALSNEQPEVPVLYVELTEEEEKLALATIDPIGAMATTDDAKLKELLADVETGSAALQAVLDDIGGAETVLLDGKTDEDAIPEVPEAAKSERGKIYELGRHRLMCGDSTSADDVAWLMGGADYDMVYTDPPYGMAYGGGRTDKFDMILGDDKDASIFYSAVPSAPEVYVWGRVENYEHINFKPRDVIVWKKNNFGLGKGYRGQYEVCFYLGAFSGSDSDVWEVKKDAKYVHPTQKPVELCERAIRNSNPESVLDVYCGSGSTLIACEKLGRTCYGMELDEKYCDVIRKRWAEFVHGEGCDWEALTPETV